MSTFILIAIILFIVSTIIGYVINKKKEIKSEKGFSEEVIKTKKLYKGSLTRYTDRNEETTILRYFTRNK